MEGAREADDNGHVAPSVARGEGDVHVPHLPGLFLAGFRDCTKETLKYLIDVERLPENDPIIIGLKQHLFNQQRLLHTDPDNNSEPNSELDSDSSKHKVDNSRDSQHSSLVTHPESCTDPGSTRDRQVSERSQDSSIDLDSTRGEECSPFESSSDQHSFESSINDTSMDVSDESHASIVSCDNVLPTNSSPFVASHGRVSIPELSEQVQNISVLPFVQIPSGSKDVNLDLGGFDLAALAQNNPSIASITSELFELLQEDDDDHVDSDDTGSSECGNGTQTVV